jgi:serine/threonine protein kinase
VERWSGFGPQVFWGPAVFGGVTTTAPPPSVAAKAKLSSRAQVIARLRHPNLVRMLPLPGGAGLVPVVNDARRLSDFMLTSAPFKRFELEQVVRLMLDVLSGLSSLHEAVVDDEHFVHGDICPQQIYVGEHGSAKLVPLTSRHALARTQPEPNGYVAPELLRGEPADARADLFSVGVMLWEALAGRRLFPDGRASAVMATLTCNKPPKLTVPTRLIWAAPLCTLVERVIALDPAVRPASAVELSNAVAKAVGKHLAKVGGDSWQDEAPTPVFQPRLHLAQLRSTTPPATVVDIEAEVTRRAATSAQLVQKTTSAPETPAAFAASSSPSSNSDEGLRSTRSPAGWLRASAFTLGAVAIAAVAWLGFNQRSATRSPATQPAAVTTLPAVVTPAPLAGELPSLPAAPAIVSLERSVAAAPAVSSAVTAPSASSRAKLSPRPTVRAKPRKAPARPVSVDYGI